MDSLDSGTNETALNLSVTAVTNLIYLFVYYILL